MPTERDTDTAFRERTQVRVRGLLLGLALGDTLTASRGRLAPAPATLPAGVVTQLACFTAEGIIRASVRMNHRGICYPPAVVWHAYGRWAYLQGLHADTVHARWSTGALSREGWPDGWLAKVPALAQRRGSAPTTVAALAAEEPGTVHHPRSTSRGSHALTRTLPLAAIVPGAKVERVAALARDIAALTHGDPAAHAAAVAGTLLAGHCAATIAVPRGVQDGLDALAALPCPEVTGAGENSESPAELADRLGSVFECGLLHRRADPDLLAALAPDATAPSALAGGLYVAASFPEQHQIVDAFTFAATAPDGVAATVGALLGAAHGIDVLPVGLLSRLELAWVLDTLARDLVAELTDTPGGSEYRAARDDRWFVRYPAW